MKLMDPKLEPTSAQKHPSFGGTFPPLPTPPTPGARRWVLPFLLTLALHGAAFLLLPRVVDSILKGFGLTDRKSERTQIQQMSAADVAKLRERIQSSQKDKKLLLSKEPDEKIQPEDPRFQDIQTLSNRNRRVEKETRALNPTSTLPLPRTGNGGNLSKLGVPLPGINAPVPQGKSSQRSKVGARQKSPSKSGSEGSPGSEQAILDDAIPTSAENLLNTRSSKFYSFYARIHQAIGPLWESRAREVTRSSKLSPKDYITRVEIILDRGGILQGVRIFESAGIQAFDRAVTESWKRVGRFPNPPAELLEKDGYLHMGWTFTFRLQNGVGWQALPPQRGF